MMLTEPPPPVLVRLFLLMAVRDGFERYVLTPGMYDHCYDMVGIADGQTYDFIGPSSTAIQEFPGILSGLGQPARPWIRLSRWGRRRVGGLEAGEFVFAVGPGSITGAYRVQWERGLVAKLEIALPLATEAFVEAARREFPILWRDEDEVT